MTAPLFSFIAGNDDFLVNRKGASLFKKQSSSIKDPFAQEIVNGQSNNSSDVEKAVSQFCQSAQTFPLFGEKRTIWFKGINFCANTQTSRSEATLKQINLLKDCLAQLDTQVVSVLVTASPIDRRNSFIKWCKENADFHLVGEDKKQSLDVQELIDQECQSMGVVIKQPAREMLIAKVNEETRLVCEEIRKLATFLEKPNAEIEERHILDLVPDFGEGNFFELAEAFDKGDLQWALEATKRHFFNNNDARSLLKILEGRTRLMIQLRSLIDMGDIYVQQRGLGSALLKRVQQKYASHFPEIEKKSNLNLFTQNAWYLGRLLFAAARIPLEELIDRQLNYIKTFKEILNAPNEQEEAMVQLVIRCLSHKSHLHKTKKTIAGSI